MFRVWLDRLRLFSFAFGQITTTIMENSINKVELLGRLGQNPKIMICGDSQVAKFSIATNERFKDRNGTLKEETTWHNVSVWASRNTDDFKLLKKGVLVYVVGKIRNAKYQNAEGEDRYYSEVTATKMKIRRDDLQNNVAPVPDIMMPAGLTPGYAMN
jgi:single-strand DNA-binding protein